jgi:hypothetical protein
MRKYGAIYEDGYKSLKPERKCSVNGCDKKHYGNGFCYAHWLQNQKKKSADKIVETCSVKGCSSKVYARHWCVKHYERNRKFGSPIKRTRFDPNEFVFHNNYVEIKLYDNVGQYKCSAIVDLEDYPIVKDKKWGVDTKGYVSFKNRGRGQLHRLLLVLTDPKIITDHINGNPLDNRRENLRICTIAQNTQNSKRAVNNISGCKGVSWNTAKGMWKVGIRAFGVVRHVGYFSNLKVAIKKAEKLRKKLHGEFTRFV